MTEVAVTGQNSALDVWNNAMEQADVITSPDLAKEESLNALVGMPMLITKMEFRRGVSRKGKPNFKKNREWDAYVTITAQLPPAEFVDFARVNMKRSQSKLPDIPGWDAIPFYPESTVVFNDGSTGIYRMAVQYLAEKGLIDLPEGSITGGKGESVLDTAPYEWNIKSNHGLSSEDDGFVNAAFDVKLAARNGIRLSQYNNDTNPDGSLTRYLG